VSSNTVTALQFLAIDAMTTPRDKRSKPRYPFLIMQQIATVADGRMPSLEDFYPACCINISCSGFAVYQDTQPDFDELVIALSVNSEPNYVIASVVYATLVEKDDRSAYRIGCQFTGRAQWSEPTQSILRKQDLESAFQMLAQ
jgi:hypothetical protein